MTTVRQSCGTPQRRARVLAETTLNGIDFLEVATPAQDVLHVELLRPLVAAPAREGVRVEGGDTIRDIRVLDVVLVPPARLAVTVDRAGDFGRYVLRLVRTPTDESAPPGFDPRLAAVEFSFKAGCPTPFDCRDDDDCGTPPPAEPRIDYLARDFEAVRRLMLDRMRLLAPAWREASPVDWLHALVDLKAYVADHQAYQQDAVATEAYLHTARRRVSVARHARLLDYAVHEGASARTWLQVVVDPGAGSGAIALPQGTRVLTRVDGAAERIADPAEERRALAQGPEVFETAEPATLFAGLDLIEFHTWGDAGCCLPRGATRATLVGALPALHPGMVLVLEEVRGPETGLAADADRAHRQAVTLVDVVREIDPLVTPALDVTTVTWHPADALAFPLCLSIRDEAVAAGAAPVVDPWTGRTIPATTVSVARGNIVACDHGRTVPARGGERLPDVPRARVAAGAAFTFTDGTPVAPRYAPALATAPLARVVAREPVLELALTETLAADLTALRVPRALRLRLEARFVLGAPLELLDAGTAWLVRAGALVVALEVGSDGTLRGWLRDAATARARIDPADARPDVTLIDGAGRPWQRVDSLVGVAADVPAFVAETEDDGTVRLRFGRGETGGQAPAEGTTFTARYRVGGGVAGNVGVEAIRHVVSADAAIVRVRNPLPGTGGTEPEPLARVRERAPYAFRRQERAVTEQDYADVALRHPRVQRAVATFRWTGSWYTVFVNVDPIGGGPVDAALEGELRALYERLRMAGTDVEIEAPRPVSLDVALEVCVTAAMRRDVVERAIRRALSAHAFADGTVGFFHPDRFSFGEPVHASRLLAAVQAVAGVASVVLVRLGRLDRPALDWAAAGTLPLGRLEIARLDADRAHPGRGRLVITTRGGR